jgi:hypothetical protein
MLHRVSEPATREILQEHLTSREWWTFVATEPDRLSPIYELERRYYSSKEASPDLKFLVLDLPGMGPVLFCFMHKSWLGPEDLADQLNRDCEAATSPDVLLQRDIVGLCQQNDWTERVLDMVFAWIGGGYSDQQPEPDGTW